MTLHLPSGVIFDLDGTLVDSAPDVTAILNAVLAAANVTAFTAAEVADFMGEGIEATIGKALTSRGCAGSKMKAAELAHQFTELYAAKPVVATQAYPHAVDVLAELDRRGVAIGVCTNKAEKPARLVLEHTGLMGHIRAVVGADSGHGLKPAAAPLRACARYLGVASPATAYIGDHAIDVAAGRAAQMRVILVTYGYGGADGRLPAADATVDCLGQLPSVLRQMAG